MNSKNNPTRTHLKKMQLSQKFEDAIESEFESDQPREKQQEDFPIENVVIERFECLNYFTCFLILLIAN